MVMSVFVFRMEYSVLGDLERIPFPNEEPIAKFANTWGRIGSFRGTVPFFSWYIYPSGLGISIWGIGRVFVPADCIESLNEDSDSLFSASRYEIIHNSPEVNSPIYLPSEMIFDKLRTIMKKRTPEINSETKSFTEGIYSRVPEKTGTKKEISIENRRWMTSIDNNTKNKVSAQNTKPKSPKLNIFLVIAVLWGIPMMCFSLSAIYTRLNIDIQGVVVSSQVNLDEHNVNRHTDYTIRELNGNVIEYIAGASDPALSRDIPVGATLVKKKWDLNYTVNGNEVDDFPRVFYPLIGSIGFAIFASGLSIGILRLRK